MSPQQSDWPRVGCLCPTYGRATRCLPEAIGSFLAQDYPGESMLFIANDAPKPIEWRGGPRVRVMNSERFPTLGHKYNHLLEWAMANECEIICHWEDDDLYLPWHITSRVRALREHPDVDCVKEAAAYVLEPVPPHCGQAVIYGTPWAFAGMPNNAYEASMAFRAHAGKAIGYSLETGRQALTLLFAFMGAKKYRQIDEDNRCPSYCFRWDNAFSHGQIIDVVKQPGWWEKGNVDFGDGPVEARDVRPYFEMLATHGETSLRGPSMSPAQAEAFREALHATR